jgi:hypothetical protein
VTEAAFKLELCRAKARGRRSYVARFYYRNSAGETVAVDSRRRPYQGAQNLLTKAREQLAADLREGEHLLDVEFANWLDEPRDGVPRVNAPCCRPLVKVSKAMRMVLDILDSAPEDWVPFGKLCALLGANTESRETALHQTIKRLKIGNRRRPPLVETSLDECRRLLVRALALPDS